MLVTIFLVVSVLVFILFSVWFPLLVFMSISFDSVFSSHFYFFAVFFLLLSLSDCNWIYCGMLPRPITRTLLFVFPSFFVFLLFFFLSSIRYLFLVYVVCPAPFTAVPLPPFRIPCEPFDFHFIFVFRYIQFLILNAFPWSPGPMCQCQ